MLFRSLGMEALGVKTSFAKAYKPRTKGKVEKFIGFLQRDFIWAGIPHINPLFRPWGEGFSVFSLGPCRQRGRDHEMCPNANCS